MTTSSNSGTGAGAVLWSVARPSDDQAREPAWRANSGAPALNNSAVAIAESR
jgi:hypothetical protein